MQCHEVVAEQIFYKEMIMLQNNQIAKKVPEGCEVCIEIKDKYIMKNVNCDNNDYAKLAYIMHSAIHVCCNNNINKIIINLNMKNELKILELNYLLSGKAYENKTKV